MWNCLVLGDVLPQDGFRCEAEPPVPWDRPSPAEGVSSFLSTRGQHLTCWPQALSAGAWNLEWPKEVEAVLAGSRWVAGVMTVTGSVPWCQEWCLNQAFLVAWLWLCSLLTWSCLFYCFLFDFLSNGFPGGASGRLSSLNQKIPQRRKWQPTPVFLPGESHGQRSLAATIHRAAKSQTRLRDLAQHFQ